MLHHDGIPGAHIIAWGDLAPGWHLCDLGAEDTHSSLLTRVTCSEELLEHLLAQLRGTWETQPRTVWDLDVLERQPWEEAGP